MSILRIIYASFLLFAAATAVLASNAAEERARLTPLIEEFNDWVARQNFPVNKLKVAYIDDNVRVGTIATDDIRDKEVYLSVPRSVIIHDELIFQTPLGPLVKEVEGRLGYDNFHRLLLFLLHERSNPSSKWKPYIDLLPQHFSNLPLGRPIEDLAELREMSTLDAILETNKSMTMRFEMCNQSLFSKNPELFPPSTYNWESYFWASNILNSRAIWMNGKRHLVPLLDSINCCGDTYKLRPHRTVLANEQAVTRANRFYRPDEQVLENYAQTNEVYFMHHGFFLEKNFYDCVNIPISILRADDPDLEFKKQYIQKNIGFAYPRNDISKFCFNKENWKPQVLLALIKIRLQTRQEIEKGVELDQRRVLEEVFNEVNQYWQKYETAVHYDDHDLSTFNLNNIHQRCLAFRITERKVLLEVMSSFRTYFVDHDQIKRHSEL